MLIGLAAGIVLPLSIIIVTGFWKLNDQIAKVCTKLEVQRTEAIGFAEACKLKHTRVDDRLGVLESKPKGWEHEQG